MPTSVASIDEALGGGLPAGRLTELVSAVPSGGGQTVIARLLAATRGARQRMALIDGADGFAPEALPPGDLRHLVWVRCRLPEQAFAVADILVRDGNYAVVVLDLRGCPERAPLPDARFPLVPPAPRGGGRLGRAPGPDDVSPRAGRALAPGP